MSKNEKKISGLTHFKKIDESDDYQPPGTNTEDTITRPLTKLNLLKRKKSVIKSK